MEEWAGCAKKRYSDIAKYLTLELYGEVHDFEIAELFCYVSFCAVLLARVDWSFSGVGSGWLARVYSSLVGFSPCLGQHRSRLARYGVLARRIHLRPCCESKAGSYQSNEILIRKCRVVW